MVSFRPTTSRAVAFSLCWWFFSAIATVAAEFVPYGFQSGVDMGSSYAGGMVYDKEHHLLYVTGQTYGEFFFGSDIGVEPNPIASNCFLGVVKLPSGGDEEFEWLHTQEMGNGSVPEACVSLVHFPTPHNKLYAVGHSEENGEVARIRPFGSTKSLVYGVVADFDVTVTGSGKDMEASLELNGGRLLHPSKGVHYPMAAAREPIKPSLFMASMSSTDSNPSLQELPESQRKPDLTKGGYKKYGREYSLIIERLVPLEEPIASSNPEVSLNETLKVEWSFQGGAKNEDDEDVDVHITSLAYISPTTMLFAGSTVGSGTAFGQGMKSTADDVDGFVTKITPTRGEVPTELPKYSARIGSDQEDYINALCRDRDSVFVIGTTYGVLGDDDGENVGSDAFVIKMDIETLDIIWIRQFGGKPGPNSFPDDDPSVHGITCAVTPDGEALYVAGNVDDGALFIDPNGASDSSTTTSSLGGDDIFLMQLATTNGAVNWAVQEGTAKHDRMAHGGGLVVDKDGNAIVMGNTNGAFVRNKNIDDEKFTDVFFLAFDVDSGKHLPSIERQKAMHNGILPPSGTPQQPIVIERDDDDDGGEQYVDDDADDISYDDDEYKSDDGGDGVSGFVVFVCVMVGIVFVVLGMCVVYRTRRAMMLKQQNSPRVDPVSPYLVNFNYGDVDMKHSASGGYHGVYTDPKYSEGVNKNRPTQHPHSDLEEIKFDVGAAGGGSVASSTFDASIVRNSLFMDDLDVPQLGDTTTRSGHRLVSQVDEDENREGQAGSQRQISTYDDLLDAYNTTWDDLNPHKLPSSGLSSSGSSRKKGAEARGLLDEDSNDDPWGQEII